MPNQECPLLKTEILGSSAPVSRDILHNSAVRRRMVEGVFDGTAVVYLIGPALLTRVTGSKQVGEAPQNLQAVSRVLLGVKVRGLVLSRPIIEQEGGYQEALHSPLRVLQ